MGIVEQRARGKVSHVLESIISLFQVVIEYQLVAFAVTGFNYILFLSVHNYYFRYECIHVPQ